MGQFMFFAILLCLLACAFAISALWQKSRTLAVVIALALSFGAGALYWSRGTPAALEPANVQPPKTIEEAITQLERLTRADPSKAADQVALARGYMAAQRYGDASVAYERASALLPDDKELPVEHAEALLRASPDRRFPPEAVRMIEQALVHDPGNQRALFFLGLHQRQIGQNSGAVATWERLLAQLDASRSGALVQQIAAARAAAGMPPMAEPAGLLQVRVELDPTLAREQKSGAVLYVFARSDAAGPPVAAKRLQPETWPVLLSLGDADSLMPTAKLSQQSSVQLMARLSRSGDATASSGDIESESVRVDAKAGTSVTLRLDRTVP